MNAIINGIMKGMISGISQWTKQPFHVDTINQWDYEWDVFIFS